MILLLLLLLALPPPLLLPPPLPTLTLFLEVILEVVAVVTEFVFVHPRPYGVSDITIRPCASLENPDGNVITSMIVSMDGSINNI